MIVMWVLLVVTFIVGAKLRRHDEGADYLSKGATTAVNGFFIGWVFLRHVCDYLPGGGGRVFAEIEFLAGQLIVVSFLFFSGYGVMEQLKRKGRAYVEFFPKRRILKVLLDFDVAVVFFVLVGMLNGVRFSLGRVAQSLIGWDSVGNSNWYIFVVLLCYAVTYVVYSSFRIRRKLFCLLILLMGCSLVLFYLKPFWWWNTMLVYPAGMAYSRYRADAEKCLQKGFWLWLPLSFGGYVAMRCLSRWVGLECPVRVLLLNAGSILFALSVVMVMMKVSFGNRVVNWMGAHVFPIYVYQRLVMIVVLAICGKNIVEYFPYLYVVVCFALTALAAVVYEKWARVRI